MFPGKRNRTPESEFRSACLKWLKIRFGRQFWHCKILGGLGQKPGIPDDLCCLRGVFYGFEWKDPGKKPRIGPRQLEQIAAINEAGGRAFVIHSFEDLEAAVQNIDPVQLGIGKARK